MTPLSKRLFDILIASETPHRSGNSTLRGPLPADGKTRVPPVENVTDGVAIRIANEGLVGAIEQPMRRADTESWLGSDRCMQIAQKSPANRIAIRVGRPRLPVGMGP